MYSGDIIKFIEEWAPPGVAWDRDNVGLQAGSKKEKIKNIFLCLELTKPALNEAVKKNCNLIFTHHPFIFNPLKNLDTDNSTKAQIIAELLKKKITLFSAHTNLDFTKDGVSFQLAKKLGLKNIDFLVNEESNQYKVVVFVPNKDADRLAESIFDSGGGIIGDYSKCSFMISGTGTFEGSENTNPTVGQRQKFEKAEEIRLEILTDKWKLSKVVESIQKNHPYEEPAFDIYPLKNKNVNYGFGAIGDMPFPLSVNEFLKLLSKKINVRSLDYNKGKRRNIKKVAVCGGSGSDLIKTAEQNGADAFVTADVKYHSFQDAEGKIMVVDAGHYETEIIVLDEVKKRLEKYLKQNNSKAKVYKFGGSTNPVMKFINNIK